MPIDTWPLDLVFGQLLKPFKGRKKPFQRVWGVGDIFMEIPEGWGGGGLTFPCENGKSEGVGGSYLKFPR